MNDESKTELDHFLRLRLRFVPLFPHTNKVARFNRSTIFCFFLEMKFVQFLQWPIKVTAQFLLPALNRSSIFLFFPIMVDNLNAAAALGVAAATPRLRGASAGWRVRERARARAGACAGTCGLLPAICVCCCLLPAAAFCTQ